MVSFGPLATGGNFIKKIWLKRNVNMPEKDYKEGD